jgi:hypothetical protein
MTTEALRKVIKVTYWILGEKGLSISYEREDSNPSVLHLILNRSDALMELCAVGDIEEISKHDCSLGKFNGHWHTYNEIVQHYKLCQWEALSIVIRHEEEKELANDMNMLELDSAINGLK